MAGMLRSLVLLAALLATACGYTPPGRVDAASPKYAADLDACDASVPDAVNKRNAKTGHSWFLSPITRWSQIDDGLNACMAGKGWGRVRSCTAEELRSGGRAGGMVVTARGVQCADPGKPG